MYNIRNNLQLLILVVGMYGTIYGTHRHRHRHRTPTDGHQRFNLSYYLKEFVRTHTIHNIIIWKHLHRSSRHIDWRNDGCKWNLWFVYTFEEIYHQWDAPPCPLQCIFYVHELGWGHWPPLGIADPRRLQWQRGWCVCYCLWWKQMLARLWQTNKQTSLPCHPPPRLGNCARPTGACSLLRLLFKLGANTTYNWGRLSAWRCLTRFLCFVWRLSVRLSGWPPSMMFHPYSDGRMHPGIFSNIIGMHGMYF